MGGFRVVQMFDRGSSLIASVSFAALVAGLSATPGYAQEANRACGSPERGMVVCNSADAPFAEGIDYKTAEDLTVVVEAGLSVNPETGFAGFILSSEGAVVLDGAGVDVIAENASAVFGFAMDDITIALDDVAATGDLGRGVDTFTFFGDTRIDTDSVSTSGDYALGIAASSIGGDISIHAGSVSSAGYSSDAITARTGGNIDIQAGSIAGEGDYVFGINSFSGNYVDGVVLAGDTRIEVGSIAISGDHAAGVVATSYGSLDIKADELAISGDYGSGVLAAAEGNVNVEVGDASFTGDYTGGVLAFSYSEASVKVGTLSAENGGGVVAFGMEGAYASADSIFISGDYANGIQSVSMAGDATLRVGEVTTNGIFAVAVNADTPRGHVDIEAGTISTQGELAMGIRAMGRSSSIEVSGSISTSGDVAFGILNSTIRGDAVVHAAGTIETAGLYADAVWVTSRYGTAEVRTDAAVSTSGNQSHAIRVTGEDGQVEIVADDAMTSGAASDGIHARTRYVEFFLGMPEDSEPIEFTGDIDITAETVRVTGAGSLGVTARGLGDARIDLGIVSARSNLAIDVNMIGDVTLRIREDATSSLSSAVRAEGEDLLITLDEGALVTGAEHGIVINAQGERCVLPNPVDGSDSPCDNPGDDDFNDPVPVEGPGGTATIANRGILSGGSGYAVMVEKGALTLDNDGTIVGAVQLAGGDDTINNAGIFEVRSDSDFGAGDDLFVNSDTVRLRTASTVGTYRFVGLESFRNEGLVDLRNGAVGDTLSLSGDYVAAGGAQIALDVDLANSRADRLVVGGAATGNTDLLLGLTDATARLTSGLVLVEVGSGSDANAFDLADESRDIGFIRYGLTYDAAAGRYLLQGIAGGGAYRQLNVIEGAENLWHSSADAWRASQAAARSGHLSGGSADVPGGLLWAQVIGGKLSRDSKKNAAGVGGEQEIDFGYRQDDGGSQFGYDFAGVGGGLRFGVTAGLAESSLESHAANEKISFDTVNAGIYASFVNGPLFGILLAKHDWHDVRVQSEAANFTAKLGGSTWGLEGEVGARFGSSAFFVEPVASFAWTRTRLENLAALGQTLDFRGANGLRGKAGARFGSQTGFVNGDSTGVYASAKAVHDFGENYRLKLISGGSGQDLASDRASTFGEGVIGASYMWRGALETFVEGQGELGSDHRAVEGRLGIRMKL
ncbi:MAG: autotransporter outer membrane beta-barrel domain-containing protein [Pseudomonadota bacterium]|nr:autotransporter outer membrane beta-barrel domain-containing protein [Pseudomonadota bacterium]